MSEGVTPREYVEGFISEFPESEVDCVKKSEKDTDLYLMGLKDVDDSADIVESVIIQKNRCIVEFFVYEFEGELFSDILQYTENCKVGYNSRYAVWDSTTVDIEKAITVTLGLLDVSCRTE